MTTTALPADQIRTMFNEIAAETPSGPIVVETTTLYFPHRERKGLGAWVLTARKGCRAWNLVLGARTEDEARAEAAARFVVPEEAAA